MKNKFVKLLSLLFLLTIPVVVFAESFSDFGILETLFMHVALTFHSAAFFCLPLSLMFGSDKLAQKKVFWKVFWVRAVVVIILTFISVGASIVLDVASIFIGGFIGFPLSGILSAKKAANRAKNGYVNNVNGVKCSKCGAIISSDSAFCTNCGDSQPIVSNVVSDDTEVYTCPICQRKLPPGNSFCITCNQSVEVSNSLINKTDIVCNKCGTTLKLTDQFCTGCGQKKTLIVRPNPDAAGVSTLNGMPSASQGTAFNAVNVFGFNFSEEQMVEEIIKKEIDKAGETLNTSIIAVEKKKTIFSFIYAIILFICVSLFFFHSHLEVLFGVFVVLTIIYFSIVRKYNLMKYLKKEVKSRPDEKIGYIVSSILSGKVNTGGNKLFRLAIIIVAIAIPLFIFREPHTIYEYDSNLGGYVIRFYTIGWLNPEEELVIPAEYEKKPVVGIRGEVFANVYTLRKVVLPDTIKEIRGQAFQYAYNLEEINIPDGIVEIKGNTFEECNLQEITIPDSVVRIGGHAFRHNTSLKKVNISPKSQLKEIGSSAFRECYDLDEIYLPRDVRIDERAFKDSGTHVKEYNEDGIVLEDQYKYNKFVYIKVNESQEVNEYNTDARIQNAFVQLLQVDGKYGNYKFKINLNGPSYSSTFELSRNKPYLVLNKDIAVEIKDDYVFNSSSNGLSFTIYYN